MRKFLTNKFTIIFIIILAIALPITIWQTQRSQDIRQRASETDFVNVNMYPTSGTFTTGTLTGPIVIQTTSTADIGSAELTINYDSEKMSLTTATPQSPLLLLTRQDSSGSSKITLYNPTSTQVVGVNTIILTLEFTPLVAGETTVTIQDFKFTATGINGFILSEPSTLSGAYTISGPTITGPATQTPTPTNLIPPSPTSSVQSGDTTLNLNVKLLGIGSSATASAQLNSNPKRTTRQGDVIVYDGNLNVIDTYPLTAKFNPQTSLYSTTADLGNLPTGDYLIKFRLDNTLFKFVPGIQKIVGGATNSYPDTLELISGDVVRGGSSENIIDIQDYSAVNACLSANISNVQAQGVNDPTCGLQIGLKSDFNDDDLVDLKDYNIILRAFTKRIGD